MGAYLGHDLLGAARLRPPAAFAARAASATSSWWRGPDDHLVPCDLLIDGDGHGHLRESRRRRPLCVLRPWAAGIATQPTRSVTAEPTAVPSRSPNPPSWDLSPHADWRNMDHAPDQGSNFQTLHRGQLVASPTRRGCRDGEHGAIARCAGPRQGRG